jgi:RHS repeat-associated protein
VRHLFTGQQWYSELGLYDLRNRYYSPDIGRFLQPDPIGFGGDSTNLYRYCGNNPLKGSDPLGLDTYFGNRYLGTSTPASFGTWSAYSTHTFVFTTNADGTLANTYSWGANGSVIGTWLPNYGLDVAAAAALAASGGGLWQGGPSLDNYVQQAYGALSQEPGHFNAAAVGIGLYDCKTEAVRLVETARYLQNVDLNGGDPGDESPSDDVNIHYVTVDSSHNAPGGAENYYPNATGGYAPGAYGFAWGDALWGYGQGPGWGNAGNFNISGESQDASNLGLALMSQGDVTYSGPGEPIEFEGRRRPLGGGDLKRAVQW